jgi:hypothetical protein
MPESICRHCGQPITRSVGIGGWLLDAPIGNTAYCWESVNRTHSPIPDAELALVP